MNVYAEFSRNARGQIATIKECEALTDEIVKSARTFINNAVMWDSGSFRPVADALRQRLLDDIYKAEYECEYWARYQHPNETNSYEYGNEIAACKANDKALELLDELKNKSIDYLYRVLKGYKKQ